MERKTKQRILGLVVVLGLGIILYPLFQSEKAPITQTAEIKPPPFPDQPVQISANEDTANQAAIDSKPDAAPIPINMPQSQDPVNQQPDDTINPATHPVFTETENTATQSAEVKPTTNAAKPATNAASSNVDATDVSADDEDEPADNTAQTVTPKPVTQQTANEAVKVKPASLNSLDTQSIKPTRKVVRTAAAHKIVIKSHPYVPGPIDNNGLVKLKNAAWVIQMGSFKKKENALRLVNNLRARGYRAFIQQVNTAFGDGTRVFVGPEGHEPTARALASRLENDTHIRGVVISYKPLAL